MTEPKEARDAELLAERIADAKMHDDPGVSITIPFAEGILETLRLAATRYLRTREAKNSGGSYT